MTAHESLRDVDRGRACILTVRAQPGAKRSGPSGAWNGLLKIAVTAPPEDGRANASVAALVAELFGLKPSAVTLIAGQTSRIKQLRLEAEPARIRARLSELLAAS